MNLEVDDAPDAPLRGGVARPEPRGNADDQDHYRDPQVQAARTALGLPPHAPTDVELECLANVERALQAQDLRRAHPPSGRGHREDTEIDSLFKTHIMRPTLDMQEEMPWLLSVFHDNSGVIAWDDAWSVCMKAETHIPLCA